MSEEEAKLLEEYFRILSEHRLKEVLAFARVLHNDKKEETKRLGKELDIAQRVLDEKSTS